MRIAVLRFGGRALHGQRLQCRAIPNHEHGSLKTNQTLPSQSADEAGYCFTGSSNSHGHFLMGHWRCFAAWFTSVVFANRLRE
jgi:hypothetical protein